MALFLLLYLYLNYFKEFGIGVSIFLFFYLVQKFYFLKNHLFIAFFTVDQYNSQHGDFHRFDKVQSYPYFPKVVFIINFKSSLIHQYF